MGAVFLMNLHILLVEVQGIFEARLMAKEQLRRARKFCPVLLHKLQSTDGRLVGSLLGEL